MGLQRTAAILDLQLDLIKSRLTLLKAKGNPNHDSKTGEFTSGEDGVITTPTKIRFNNLVKEMGVKSIHASTGKYSERLKDHPLLDYVGDHEDASAFLLNEVLRNGYANAGNNLITKPSLITVTKQIKRITDYINQHKLPRDIEVYRGLKPNANDYIDSLKPGAEIADAGFLSTTMKKQLALDYAGIGASNYWFEVVPGRAIRIILPKATPAVPIVLGGESEEEVLVQRGSRFKVLSKVEGLTRLLRL